MFYIVFIFLYILVVVIFVFQCAIMNIVGALETEVHAT